MKASPRQMAEAVTALFSAWNRPMVSGVIDGYSIALYDLTPDELRRGVRAAVKAGGQHPPSAGELRKLCLGEDTQSLEARAVKAFHRAEDAAKRHGVDFNPRRLNDPLLTHAIGALGGWSLFCGKPINEWQQRNFVAAYVATADNPELREVVRLSHDGKPIGALPELRAGLARSLTVDAIRPPGIAP